MVSITRIISGLVSLFNQALATFREGSWLARGKQLERARSTEDTAMALAAAAKVAPTDAVAARDRLLIRSGKSGTPDSV